MSEQIRCVQVWDGWLRLSHWVIAAGTGFLFVSAWLVEHARVDVAFWTDWHVITGQIVALALMLRTGLMFRPGSGHWRAWIPDRAQRQAMVAMVKFYVSLARMPLPAWYAHNPLWLPLYALMYLLLVLVVGSGFLYQTPGSVLGFDMVAMHAFSAWWLGVLALAHVVTAILHDWKGQGASISAMINGNRYFHVSTSSHKPPDEGVVRVAVDSIRRRTDATHDQKPGPKP